MIGIDRRVRVDVTRAGRAFFKSSPPLLQERFVHNFTKLQDWEQTMLLISLLRLAAMMAAEGNDASPDLSSVCLRASAEMVEEVLEPHGDGQRPSGGRTRVKRPD